MNHEEMNQRFSRLENEIAELNKKLSALMPSEDANKRRDEQFAALTIIAESDEQKSRRVFPYSKKQRALCK
nr:hypothetical protein [Escherichia coli]